MCLKFLLFAGEQQTYELEKSPYNPPETLSVDHHYRYQCSEMEHYGKKQRIFGNTEDVLQEYEMSRA